MASPSQTSHLGNSEPSTRQGRARAGSQVIATGAHLAPSSKMVSNTHYTRQKASVALVNLQETTKLMSDKSITTRYDTQTPHLQMHPSEMTPAWQRVHADLLRRGFAIAANNMRDIMRLTTPKAYWQAVNSNT